MGLTPAEFFRTLPAAIAGMDYRIGDGRVEAVHGDRRLLIRLEPLTERRIALLRIPSTRVRIRFENHHPSEIKSFMRRFHRHFQRGGG